MRSVNFFSKKKIIVSKLLAPSPKTEMQTKHNEMQRWGDKLKGTKIHNFIHLRIQSSWKLQILIGLKSTTQRLKFEMSCLSDQLLTQTQTQNLIVSNCVSYYIYQTIYIYRQTIYVYLDHILIFFRRIKNMINCATVDHPNQISFLCN